MTINKKTFLISSLLLIVPSVAFAVVTLSTHDQRAITNPANTIDGTTATAASAGVSIAACPTGFTLTNGRCVHGATGVEFYGWQIIEVDSSLEENCAWDGLLTHSRTFGTAATHVFYSDNLSTWNFEATFNATSSATNHYIYFLTFPQDTIWVLLGRSTAGGGGMFAPALYWHELVMQDLNLECEL